MIKKVMVPLDQSQLARKVLDMALSIVDKFDADLVLLRIDHRPATLDADVVEQDLDYIDKETEALLDEATERLGAHTIHRSRISAEVRSGPLVETIAAAVQEHMIDLVIMGTHGRSGLYEQLTGSTSEQIVANTSVSVLVVKPDGFPYLRD
ncbi:MAG: nucleotide-binding universal stress UspA family protein [Myxococcota bacterium]|jgi:nucleotide-binding universal stress UspA family protein